MIPKIPVNQHIKNFRQLIRGKNTQDNSRLLSEKFSSELSSIQELLTYIDNKEANEKRIIMAELGTFTQIKEFEKGHFFKNIFGTNSDFIMLLKGTILEFEIKYVNIVMSFQEFILYLTNLFLLNEKNIYWDCIEKNCDAFPFKTFKYYIENLNAGLKMQEEEKNIDKSWIKNINVIDICKELNMKEFDFVEELKKLKNKIQNSEWNNYQTNNSNLTEEDYIKMINSFFDLYNFNLNLKVKTKITTKEVKYKVCLPYFYKKRVLNPISFIGDLNRPIQMKNYSSFISLSDCFVIYVDKYKLSPNRLLFKYIYNNKINYIAENLFKKHHLFKNINTEYLNNFGKYMQIINLNKNETLFEQDEPHKGIYIIMKGSLQLETYRSNKDLIYVKFLLMHSLDYCPDYISNHKKNEIFINSENRKNKSYLNGYYDYNSELNILMKNPVFKEKSKIKENIVFCIYKKNDILGLGEIFDYKNQTNIFTAKSLSDNTELIFIPREIFQALLTIEFIYNQCGSLTEEKTRLLDRCIDKYKSIFEKKIELMLNNKKIYQKIKIFNNKRQTFGNLNILNRIKLSGFNTKKGKYIIGPANIFLNKNKSQIVENDKNNLSDCEKSVVLRDNNKINNFIDGNDDNNKESNDFLSMKNQLIKNNRNKNDNLEKKLYSNTLIVSTNNETNNKLLLNDYNTKALLNSQFPSINKRKYKIEDSSINNSNKKRLKSSIPVYLSCDFNYNSENAKIFKQKNKRNKKINIRSLSAQKFDEQDIKQSILNYQNNYKELDKIYNNLSGKSRSFFPGKINLNKKKDNIYKNAFNLHNSFKNIYLNNNKRIVINKFNSSSLFRKNMKMNNISNKDAI